MAVSWNVFDNRRREKDGTDLFQNVTWVQVANDDMPLDKEPMLFRSKK